MDLNLFFNNSIKLLKQNAPEILTALGVSGLLTTAYLTHKAAYVASEIIHENEKEWIAADKKERYKERVRQTWRLYIPAGISGVVTVGCIIGASRGNNRRTAAAITAYSLTERAFSEYKEKVVEQVGKGKEQKIRDEIVQDHVSRSLKVSDGVVLLGTGQVMCCELMTDRYFQSNMQTLQKAQNDINAKIINELYVTLDEFYDRIGIPYTSMSSKLGWDSNSLVELRFSTVLTPDGIPCLAFEYSYTKPLS